MQTSSIPHAASSSTFAQVHRRHRRRLRRAAYRAWRRLPASVDLADVEQEAQIALLETLRTHDESRAPWAGHLKRRLQWAMGDVARRSYRRLDPSRGVPTFAARSVYEDGRRTAPHSGRSHLAAAGGTAAPASCPNVEEISVSDEASPEEQVIRRDLRRQLRAAIATLPPRQRAVAVGHYLEGRPLQEVAEELRVSPFTVSRLHRSLVNTLTKRLRRHALPDVRRPSHAPAPQAEARLLRSRGANPTCGRMGSRPR